MTKISDLKIGNLYIDHEEDIFLYVGHHHFSYDFLGVDRKRTKITEVFNFPEQYVVLRIRLLAAAKENK